MDKKEQSRLAKAILPGGKGRSGNRWSVTGGRAGKKQIEAAVERAEALGFEYCSGRDSISQAGPVGYDEVYENADGVQLWVGQSYGVTAAYNRFSMELVFPES